VSDREPMSTVPSDGTPVLSFTDVVKRRFDGCREVVVLDRVSLEVASGDLVGVHGGRRAGKSTLLRLAAGLELPDEGAVVSAGCDVGKASALQRARLLRTSVGLVSADYWHARSRATVVDYLVLSVGADGVSAAQARRRAYGTLDEVGMAGIGLEPSGSLPTVERMKLMLACALMRQPRLLLIDEPAVIPSLTGRDRFMSLVRTTASARQMAVVVASEELAAVQGASVVMSLSSGQLRSSEQRGVVVRFPSLPRAAGESAGV
jgi:ABC-type multidrug transport system ATPase subunit